MRGRIDVLQGDITTLAVDAIVNAANSTLLGGGGVDGAIHRAAGPRLREACGRLGGCFTGDAKLTGGYDLPARFVIHTVGPVWQGGQGGEAEALASCYRRSFALAVEQEVLSIAFPAISTGAYGYPLEQATRIAALEARTHLEHESSVNRIVFACFSEEARDLYVATLEDTVDLDDVAVHSLGASRQF